MYLLLMFYMINAYVYYSAMCKGDILGLC